MLTLSAVRGSTAGWLGPRYSRRLGDQGRRPDGVLVATDKSWSIDDLRLNFQFSCEIAWEIKHGRRTRILRDPFYTGLTPELWGSCDAVCDARDWRLWGITSCGKGDPMQVMHVGHGASPARFRGVTVGSAS